MSSGNGSTSVAGSEFRYPCRDEIADPATDGVLGRVAMSLEIIEKAVQSLSAMGAVLCHNDEQSALSEGSPLEAWVVLGLHAGVESVAALVQGEIESIQETVRRHRHPGS